MMKLTKPKDPRLEYGEKWSDRAQQTMIAFANDLGGILQIGVADDGEVVGCRFDEVDRRVMTFARDGVEPPMAELVRVIPQEIEGKTIASVVVSPGISRPYAFKGKLLANGGVYIRLGGQTVAANIEEVIRIIQRGDPRTWEMRPSSVSELTLEAAERIFKEMHVRFSEATWLGYGLVNRQKQFTNLAQLLSDQCEHRTMVNTYGEDGRIESTRRIEGSLLQQMVEVLKLLESLNVPVMKKVEGSLERQEKTPWPKIALRKALTNSLAHRDYSSPIQSSINVYPDRIVFLTPGGIPPEITLDDAVLEGVSFCRNEKLADIFMRLGWMEKAGTGFGDIFREYAPYEQKPTLRHVVRTFLLELPRTDRKSDARETEVIDFVRGSATGKTRPEIDSFLGVSRPTTAKILDMLLASGQITRIGKGRAVRYTTPGGRKQNG